jgi:hypothetical protein
MDLADLMPRRPLIKRSSGCLGSILTSEKLAIIAQLSFGSGGASSTSTRLGFACNGNACVCSSDADCNGMFATACGAGYSKCWTRTGGAVFYVCSR